MGLTCKVIHSPAQANSQTYRGVMRTTYGDILVSAAAEVGGVGGAYCQPAAGALGSDLFAY